LNTIYFVRHGQTDWNKALRWQGSSDNPLNQVGREQAERIAAYFAGQDIEIEAIYSSPLLRARTTGDTICKTLRLNLIVEPVFHELSLGDYEGKTTDELKAEYGELFDDWLKRYHLDAAPGGENLSQGILRVSSVLQSLLQQFDKAIIIVGHQAILSAMKAALSGETDIQTLAAYKQANDEVDIWDVASASLRERVKLS